ncbi:MAG TPA: acyl carrier protein [Actinomycetota bacterium]|nr:acyl carrier protein [Actinomycetota bacterium]
MYREAIRSFISRSFPHEFSDDEDLFASGHVNEEFSMQIVTFVEREFGVHVRSDEYDVANFRSVNAINDFVERKKAEG